MFFMHSRRGTACRALTRLRESLSYFFQIFKELPNPGIRSQESGIKLLCGFAAFIKQPRGGYKYLIPDP